MADKMLNLVLFGPPGSGKGTQSENLINKYGLVHLSTGDMLRSEIARGTALGKKAKEIMDRGELVGDDIVIGIIESKIDENPRAEGFIFDGFPRTIAQAVALDDLLQKKGTGISAMLALEVEDQELIKRLLQRGKETGRTDDRDTDVIKRRIAEYNAKTLPLKKYFSEQGKFHSIHGIGRIDEIFKALVDRITFLRAEMDLTGLETEIEHLDMTIRDFEIAQDIDQDIILEIDAIKRAEAEEATEARRDARKKKLTNKSRTSASKQTPVPAKKKPAKKKLAGKKTSLKSAGMKKKPAKTRKLSAKKVSRKKTKKNSKKASPKRK
jgi:adenylate kinase